MKFLIEDVFPLGVAEYEALYFDEAFWSALGESLRLGRELVKLDRTPARIVRTVRCWPDREPGTPADQAFGKQRAGYVEELDYDVRARKGAWRTIPNVFTDRVRTEGTIEFVTDGAGTRRIVRGDVDVRRAYGFGKIIEKMIVSEIEKSYVKSAAFTRDWIAR